MDKKEMCVEIMRGERGEFGPNWQGGVSTCPFCSHYPTIYHDEHWVFCPNCGADWTDMILQEIGCKHVRELVPLNREKDDVWGYHVGIMVVDTLPEVENHTINPNDEVFLHNNRCSKCGEKSMADGW